MFSSHRLNLFLFLPLVSDSLSLSPPPALFLSPPLTHLSFILFLLFIVSFSGTACPSEGLTVPVSCFSSHLDFFLFPLSFSPSLLYSLHFSFKHLLLLTRTPLLLSEMGSGSLSPPPPTYHRVYYICHHLLLA